MTSSLKSLITDGWRNYRNHWWLLSKPLVQPTVFIIAGCALWLFAPWWFKQHGCPMLSVELTSPLGLLGFVLSMVPGMWLFFKGFWDYLVWFAASNIVLATIITHGHATTTQVQQAQLSIKSHTWDYSLLLASYSLIGLIPIVAAAFCSSLISLTGAPAEISLGIAALVFLGLGLLVLPCFLFLSLLVQSFSTEPQGVLGTFLLSVKRFLQAPLQASLIWLLGIVLGSLIIPSILLCVCQLFKLNLLFNLLVEPIMLPYAQQIVELVNPPLGQSFPITGQAISLMVTEAIIQSVASIALLPLYNSWHTSLYCQLQQQQPSR